MVLGLKRGFTFTQGVGLVKSQLTRAKFSIMQSFPRHAMRAKLIKRGFRRRILSCGEQIMIVLGVMRAQVQAWKLNMLKYYGTELRIMA